MLKDDIFSYMTESDLQSSAILRDLSNLLKVLDTRRGKISEGCVI